MNTVVVCSAARTPIGKFLGALSGVSAVELGVVAVRAALERARCAPDAVDQLFLGMARQAGEGPNVARQVTLRAGLPQGVTAMTVNQACASGLRALLLGSQQLLTGEAEVVVVGGVETMSRNPFLLPGMRMGYRLGDAPLLDGNYQDGFHCPLAGTPMGATAETLASQYDITRAEQDAFAVESQRKAEVAIKEGRFVREIAAVTVKGKKGDVLVEADEHPRAGTTLADMAKLPPVFKQDGSVHAGNSSGITDGAAALVLTTEARAEKRGLPILARLEASALAGVDPNVMGIGPVPATRKLLERARLELEDFDLVELNEAFAAQVIACDRELHLDPARLNVNGGSIALGHPIGCTGARIVVTLLHEMERRSAQRGLATLCVSGGMGIAASFVR